MKNNEIIYSGFLIPEAEIIHFDTEDVITTSPPSQTSSSGIELPKIDF